jgi:hypothetical protein
MIYSAIRQMKKMLENLDKWLDAATAYAQKKNFEPNSFLAFRLAPDQFALVRQIQSTCDTAKFAAARLSGKDAPKHPDDEQTIEALKARIQSVVTYLDSFKAHDFEGAVSRVVQNPRWEGKVMHGGDYFNEHSIPNFYFHAAHAYAILRHNGVDVGKRDYLGTLTLRDPAKG